MNINRNLNNETGFQLIGNRALMRRPIDTIQALGRDITFAGSTVGYDLWSLYNFLGNVATDAIGNSQALEALGTNTSISTDLLVFNGADTLARVQSITGGRNRFSVLVHVRYDTMVKSPFTIIALSSNNSITGVNDEFVIRRSFGEIQVRVRSSAGTDMPLFQKLTDVSAVVANGYFNFWIVREFNVITFSISDGASFNEQFTYDAGTVNNSAVHLLINEPVVATDTISGNVERIAVFEEAYNTNQRHEIEQITAKSSQSDFETTYSLSSERNLNLQGNRILNVSQPSVAGDVATKSYVDNAVGTTGGATQLIDSEDNIIVNTAGGSVAVSNKKISGVLIPEVGTDVANKNYVDTNDRILKDNSNVEIVSTEDGDISVNSYMTRFKDIGDNKKGRTLDAFLFPWVDVNTAYIVLSSRENSPEGLTSGSLTIRGSGRNRDVQAKDAFTAEVTWRTAGENTGTRGGNFKWTTARSDVSLSLIECEFDGFMSICVKILATGASGSGIRAQISLSGIINSDTFLPTLRTDAPLNEAPIANSSFNFDSPIQVNAIDTRSGDEINFADNTLINIHTAQFNGQADAGLQPALLRLTQGQSELDFNESPQISFGYNGGTNFQHFITTTHNSETPNNSIHIFTCDGKSNNTLTDGSNRVWSFDNQENRSYVNLDMEGNNILGAGDINTSMLTTGEITSTTATFINAGSGKLRMTGSGGNFYFQTGDGTYQALKLGVVHNSTSSRLDIDSSQTVSKQVLNMDTTNKIINLAEPDNSSDAATKNYVDTKGGGFWASAYVIAGQFSGINPKQSRDATVFKINDNIGVAGTGQYIFSTNASMRQNMVSLTPQNGCIPTVQSISATSITIYTYNFSGNFTDGNFYMTLWAQ